MRASGQQSPFGWTDTHLGLNSGMMIVEPFSYVQLQTGGDGGEADFDWISLKQILSDYIEIQGTYSWNTNINSGLQTLRLELNDARVPTKVMDINQVRFNG
jgi:hypothetical protein